MNGIYSTDWHPKKDIIVFSGNDGKQSDIYTYNLKTKELSKLTDDPYGAKNPKWNADGNSVLYTSERTRSLSLQSFRHPYQSDIWQVSYPQGEKTAVTSSDWDEDYAISAPDGKTVIYTSDQNGILNIWVHPEDQEPYAITNILGGVFHLDIARNGETLVLTAFQNGGWDIYRINAPLNLPPLDLDFTEFRKTHYTIETSEAAAFISSSQKKDEKDQQALPGTISEIERPERQSEYSKFVFIPRHRQDTFSDADTIALDSTVFLTETGDYI
ncbi:MAG TPA: hypothetical protein ENO01_01620, partial [Candidatus Marinimicrobia bacterium]|nr:hypothetical protein [Candidatus Neomarinimicrobiota bacterium]